MKTTNKNAGYYLSLPYAVEVTQIGLEEGGGYVACVPLLGRYTAVGDGETPAAAYASLYDALPTLFEEWIEEGHTIPEPTPEAEVDLPSGKLSLRLPRTLHAQVKHQAKEEGVSINDYISNALAQSVAGSAMMRTLEDRLARMEEQWQAVAHPRIQVEERVSVQYNFTTSSRLPSLSKLPFAEGNYRAS